MIIKNDVDSHYSQFTSLVYDKNLMFKLTRKQKYLAKAGLKIVDPRKKMYLYTLDDLAALYNLKLETLRNYICDNKVDPDSLQSICEFYCKRKDELF